MKKLLLTIPMTLMVCAVTSIGLADDFKTMDGKEYKDATVSRVEPDGIVVKTKSGISKLYFVRTSRKRFNSAFIMIRKQRVHTLPSRLLSTRCTKSNRRGLAIDKRTRTRRTGRISLNNKGRILTLRWSRITSKLRQQQKAVQEANRHQEALEWAAHRHRRHR